MIALSLLQDRQEPLRSCPAKRRPTPAKDKGKRISDRRRFPRLNTPLHASDDHSIYHGPGSDPRLVFPP